MRRDAERCGMRGIFGGGGGWCCWYCRCGEMRYERFFFLGGYRRCWTVDAFDAERCGKQAQVR